MYDKTLSEDEILERENIRMTIEPIIFWRRFDEFVFQETKENLRLRPSTTCFSSWEIALDGWWAAGAHAQILKYILLGYKISFSAEPPMTFTHHEERIPKFEKSEELEKLLTEDVESGKMFYA